MRSSSVPSVNVLVVTSSCTGGAARHRRSPYSHPASSPLQLETAKTGAVAPGAPCSTVNAVTDTCRAPK
ncbi:hypothetical protein ACJ6WF_45800 [Streptomyces sp. MMS24-I2-30]|uniref:hypothetical protein n=1 Tax=Streptomyces sp. MMS24-I2-30 TaxID=3351564 RepID=UPI0038969B9D